MRLESAVRIYERMILIVALLGMKCKEVVAAISSTERYTHRSVCALQINYYLTCLL
jgi:hypothetical protein